MPKCSARLHAVKYPTAFAIFNFRVVRKSVYTTRNEKCILCVAVLLLDQGHQHRRYVHLLRPRQHLPYRSSHRGKCRIFAHLSKRFSTAKMIDSYKSDAVAETSCFYFGGRCSDVPASTTPQVPTASSVFPASNSTSGDQETTDFSAKVC